MLSEIAKNMCVICITKRATTFLFKGLYERVVAVYTLTMHATFRIFEIGKPSMTQKSQYCFRLSIYIK